MARMTITGEISREMKDALMSLHKTATDAEECLFMLQTAFIHHSLQHINECRKRLQDIMSTLNMLSQKVARLAEDDPKMKPYISVPNHLMLISENIEKIAQLFERRINEGILFSPKAVEETTFLLQRVIELLRPAVDIILARNEILANYVKESESDIVKKALEYATLHEERLIEGICQPVSSALYLSMLDAVKSIAWHTKQIAVKLTS